MEWTRSCTLRAATIPLEATTTSVGRPWATSRAKVGPERKASRSGSRSGIVSSRTIDISLSVRSSMPFVATTTIASRRTPGAASVDTARRWLDGGTRTTRSALAATCGASADARMVSGSETSGRYGEFVCRVAISSATSGSYAHIVTACSSRARWQASAVPQAPEPTTAIRAIGVAPSRPEPPYHLPLPGVVLLQGLYPLLRHLVPNHPVAFRRELVEVDPHGVRGARALGDDARLEQRLDERAEHVAPALHEGAAVRIGARLQDRVAHPLPVEAELGVDEPLLLGVH